MQQSALADSAANANGTEAQREEAFIDPRVLEQPYAYPNLYSPRPQAALPTPTPPRATEIVDLQDDYNSDEDEQVPERSNETLIDKPERTLMTDSYGERTSTWHTNGLSRSRNDHRQDYRAASNGLYPPKYTEQYVSPYASTFGVVRASLELGPQLISQDLPNRNGAMQDLTVDEEAQDLEKNALPDTSVQPIFDSPPGEARPVGDIAQKDATWRSAKGDPTKFEADQAPGNWRPLENLTGPMSAAYTDKTGDGAKQVYAIHNGQPGVFYVDVQNQKAVFLGRSAPDAPLRYTLIRITSYPHPTKMHLKLRLPPGVPAQRGAHALHQASERGCWIKFRAAMQECTNLLDPDDKHTGALVSKQWYFRIEDDQPELMDVVRQMVACTRIRRQGK